MFPGARKGDHYGRLFSLDLDSKVDRNLATIRASRLNRGTVLDTVEVARESRPNDPHRQDLLASSAAEVLRARGDPGRNLTTVGNDDDVGGGGDGVGVHVGTLPRPIRRKQPFGGIFSGFSFPQGTVENLWIKDRPPGDNLWINPVENVDIEMWINPVETGDNSKVNSQFMASDQGFRIDCPLTRYPQRT